MATPDCATAPIGKKKQNGYVEKKNGEIDKNGTATSPAARKGRRRRPSFVAMLDIKSWHNKLAVQSAAMYQLAEEDSELGKNVRHSLRIMEEALERYGDSGLSISFNGGKDCTVMLHLWSAVRYKFYGCLPSKLHALYIIDPNTFEEIDLFVNECVQRYHLDLVAVEGTIKTALADMLAFYPEIQAVFVGARRTDQTYYRTMAEAVPCDKGWPRVMRIHPILDWRYYHIWEFLLRFEVPYCSLYDRGYTSIGNIYNTVPNPALQNDELLGGYEPAWMLQDEGLERAGRVKDVRTSQAAT